MAGSVHALHRCPGHRRPMERLEQVEVDEAGLAGDSHRGAASIRHVLVQDEEVCRTLDLSPGEVKENITVSGIDANSLPYGTHLTLGEVVLELTKECGPCSRMDEIRPGLREQLLGRRGVYAKVVTPGTLRVGDPVSVQTPAEVIPT
ncbi:MAG: MOSC domain-containing protein [Actinomycetota bacterium]